MSGKLEVNLLVLECIAEPPIPTSPDTRSNGDTKILKPKCMLEIDVVGGLGGGGGGAEVFKV